MKKITTFYYGEGDSDEAVRLAQVERAGHNAARIVDAGAFDGEIEQCSEVVILTNVKDDDRKKIEAAYSGTLIKLRGSPKWYGGEVKTEDAGPGAHTSVVIPDSQIVSGPKANPEDVSPAAANPAPAVLPHEPRRRGRPRKIVAPSQ